MWKETMSSAGKIAKAMHLASALLNWILQLSMQDSVYVADLATEYARFCLCSGSCTWVCKILSM